MSIISQFSFENIDEPRGYIRKIAKDVDVLEIFSRKGSIRADHYHLESSHLCKLLSGSMLYFARPAFRAYLKPTKWEIKAGDYFFTDKLIEHQMCFLEDSIFLCFSFGSRKQEDYEKDLVRIPYSLKELYDNWKD